VDYCRRGTPKDRITALNGDLDRLYDGSMLSSTAEWWNCFLAKRPALVSLGAFRFYDKRSSTSSNGQ
jgi:hypothetical protein